MRKKITIILFAIFAVQGIIFLIPETFFGGYFNIVKPFLYILVFLYCFFLFFQTNVFMS